MGLWTFIKRLFSDEEPDDSSAANSSVASASSRFSDGTFRATSPVPMTVSEFPVRGLMSTFGGPFDTGVKPNEGLAYVHETDLNDDRRFAELFLRQSPNGTSGLARRINPAKFYCAMRFPETPRWYARVRSSMVRVTNSAGKSILCVPADWGPADWTHRVIDLSPGAAAALGAHTDRTVVMVELIPLAQIASEKPAPHLP